ncbi:Na/Pi cotransporter family protein [Algiphilus aromaticivorans]|jgi:phosphate:Na+ symporter|uniref:Na/Pi cotransporter family protein n=1 Tax=Algiphilus aromaticivorans TaxID=382454 RepID=UPI0005C1C051|nr:Na/Pi symporter [Algiphilus aromaticivorans]
MDWSLLGATLGGIGLLLLGMHIMTDGLREAAGDALRGLLVRATGRPLRAVASGVLITGIVQSSSAVTVATIGFVNAGLLNLTQAIPVIYGSNVGTTATAWLVALVGFHIDVRLLALPMIGVGMLLRVFAGPRRIGAVGMALVGFGIFFTGIDTLRVAFADIGSQMPIAQLVSGGWLGLFVALGLGFALTLLMQSSSAALTIILTVAAGGMVALPSAAVMVIGANLGTTSTALIAVIGATPNARRAAAAHFAFNLGTGVVALLLLPLLLWLLSLVAESTGEGASAAAVLALFHTAFNVLGVLIFLPLTPRLVAFVSARFRTAEEDLARPQHLDGTLLHTPSLALDALARELERAAALSRGCLIDALQPDHAAERLAAREATVTRLVDSIGDYCQQLQQTSMSADSAMAMAEALQALRHIGETAASARTLSESAASLSELPAEAREAVSEFAIYARAQMQAPEDSESDREARYQASKAELLRADSRVPVRTAVRHLERLGVIRDGLRSALRARQHLEALPRQAIGAELSN